MLSRHSPMRSRAINAAMAGSAASAFAGRFAC
jgi:hypothetical protein